MWALTNYTPFQAASTWLRDQAGVHKWIVAVKGTFEIRSNGRLDLAEEQVEPLLAPEYHGEDGTSSLRYDADLVLPKSTTDVVLNATAYAPNGRPSSSFTVEARINGIRKVIRVFGNRHWSLGLSSDATTPEPITQVPILYEYAYGGYDHAHPDPKRHRLDTRNPVGRGVFAQPRHRVGQPLPNLEYPVGKMEEAGPAGFGAIASFWSPRRELNGTYDEAWQRSRRPLLPGDWDPRSLLCSPVDQRPETFLVGGERIELINLTPEGWLRFTLPRFRFSFSTYFGKRVEEHGSHLSTVIVEPDHPRVIVVWLGSLTCLMDTDYLDETIVREALYKA